MKVILCDGCETMKKCCWYEVDQLEFCSVQCVLDHLGVEYSDWSTCHECGETHEQGFYQAYHMKYCSLGCLFKHFNVQEVSKCW